MHFQTGKRLQPAPGVRVHDAWRAAARPDSPPDPVAYQGIIAVDFAQLGRQHRLEPGRVVHIAVVTSTPRISPAPAPIATCALSPCTGLRRRCPAHRASASARMLAEEINLSFALPTLYLNRHIAATDTISRTTRPHRRSCLSISLSHRPAIHEGATAWQRAHMMTVISTRKPGWMRTRRGMALGSPHGWRGWSHAPARRYRHSRWAQPSVACRRWRMRLAPMSISDKPRLAAHQCQGIVTRP